ncbi:MAG: YerC/YecD family TrpR-related protein [Candidatus Peribacteraceae bacterium]|nr:YerC/YecD family TrpR-related protein [Candidatus Peribacteraceae bacterium]MDD5742085.1 YerC/YecD family TrpR-related protein [Candidatus Peribacteraceae bacterium]
MGKRRFTEGTWRSDPLFRRLCRAFLACRTENDVANFLRDVATLAELKALSERLEVARLLLAGVSYREAAKCAPSSTATVTRVAVFLNGSEGGYRSVLDKHQHHHVSPRGERMVSKA